MTADAVVSSVPASIAAIMTAIRDEIGDGGLSSPVGAGSPSDTAVAPVTPIVAAAVAPVSRGAADTVLEPVAAFPAETFDGEMRKLLAPLLRDWLDAHLPELVETAVTAEIRRLTGQS